MALRSWAAARYILEEGCAWTVGDNKMVNVWYDHWLPALHLPKPVSTKPFNTDVLKVADLRNPNGVGWNTRLPAQLFTKEEIELIFKVPVSALG